MSLNDLPSDLEREFEVYALCADIIAIAQSIEDMAVDFGGIITTTTSAVDGVKRLLAVSKAAQELELREGLIELREQLLEIKESLLEAREENAELKAEIERLRRPQIKLELSDAWGVFFEKGDNTIAYCPNCYIGRKTINVLSSRTNMSQFFKCAACGWTNSF